MGILVEDRRNLVENLTRLSLWFAGQRALAGDPLRDVMGSKTPLYRLTVLWDGTTNRTSPEGGWQDPGWDTLVGRLERIRLRHGGRGNAEQWEQEGLDVLWPYLEPRIERDVRAWPWIPSCLGATRPEAGVFGFFLYEWQEVDEDGGPLLLHMGNSLAPRSPFDDMAERARDLLLLLGSARKARPNVGRLVSNSWLNSFGPFMRLFPPEWSSEATPGPLGYTYDWWGQFVTRRGSYHSRNGQRFRLTHSFPYPSVACGCDIGTLSDYLKNEYGL